MDDSKKKVGAPVQTQLPVEEKSGAIAKKPEERKPLIDEHNDTRKIAYRRSDNPVDEINLANKEVDELKRQLKEKDEAQKFMVKASDVETKYLNPTIWAQMKGMAEVFARSGAFPPDMNSNKLMVILEAGLEMGMKPIESVKSFYFVKGTLNIFGAAITRRLREHGWRIDYVEKDNECTAVVRKNGEEYRDVLTFDDAEKSGWTKTSTGGIKPGWLPGINRKLKLRYGALSMIVKTYLPEVLGSATDIAEVAMDMAPVISGETMPAKTIEIKDGNNPADPNVISMIKTLKEKLGDQEPIPESLSKVEAAEMVKDLTLRIAKKNKEDKAKKAEKKEEVK